MSFGKKICFKKSKTKYFKKKLTKKIFKIHRDKLKNKTKNKTKN